MRFATKAVACHALDLLSVVHARLPKVYEHLSKQPKAALHSVQIAAVADLPGIPSVRQLFPSAWRATMKASQQVTMLKALFLLMMEGDAHDMQLSLEDVLKVEWTAQLRDVTDRQHLFKSCVENAAAWLSGQVGGDTAVAWKEHVLSKFV